MSEASQSRRAAVEVSFAGVNITDSIRPYLLSLTYTDNEEDEADDLQIKLQDKEGIWLTSWLTGAVDAAASAGSQTASSVSSSQASRYRVTPAIGLNVRTGPGTGYQKLGALPYGTEISVSEISAGWAKTVYRGQTAYVCAQYLTAIGAESASDSFSVGDTVEFVGNRHYVSSTGNQGYAAKQGPAKITLSNPGSLHPWHLIHIDGTSNVYGWVDESDIRAQGSKVQNVTEKNENPTQTGFSMQAVILRENWTANGRDDLLECGAFELDSIKASGPPSVITIKATSLPYSAQIRQTKKSRAWESYSLSGIAREIAISNEMAYLFESTSDPSYTRVEQYQESDIAFLSRLCHSAGISLKASNRILVLFDQAAYEQKPSSFTITRGDGSYLKYDLSTGTADTKYSSCRVRYADPATGRTWEGIAYAEDYKEDAKNNQQLEVTAKVSSIAQAQELAAKHLRLHNKFARTATFTFPGSPSIAAGVTATLQGWGAWDGKYIVKQARHSIGSSGYTTQAVLRRALEG